MKFVFNVLGVWNNSLFGLYASSRNRAVPNLICVPFLEFCATERGTCKLAGDPVSRGSGSENNFECADDNSVLAISV